MNILLDILKTAAIPDMVKAAKIWARAIASSMSQ